MERSFFTKIQNSITAEEETDNNIIDKVNKTEPNPDLLYSENYILNDRQAEKIVESFDNFLKIDFLKLSSMSQYKILDLIMNRVVGFDQIYYGFDKFSLEEEGEENPREKEYEIVFRHFEEDGVETVFDESSDEYYGCFSFLRKMIYDKEAGIVEYRKILIYIHDFFYKKDLLNYFIQTHFFCNNGAEEYLRISGYYVNKAIELQDKYFTFIYDDINASNKEYICPGVIGIFDYDQLKYFILEKDIEDKEENSFLTLGLEIHKIEDIQKILGSNNINFEVLKTLFSKHFRYNVLIDFNIDIYKFNLVNQLQFLKFIQKANKNKMENVKKFIVNSDNKEGRFKAFLSLNELGEKFGDSILELGELENADEIFKIYVSLIDKTENIREELQDILKDKNRDVNEDVINKIVKNILIKGANILSDFSNSVEKNKENSENLSKELKEKLEKYDSDIIFSLDIYKTLLNEGTKVSPEEIEGIEFSRKRSKELFIESINKKALGDIIDEIFITECNNFKVFKEGSKTLSNPEILNSNLSSIYDMFQMITMYKKNLNGKPKEDIKYLLNKFKERILRNDDSIEIFKYKKNDEILSFFMLISEEDSKEFVSYNTSKKARGYEVGKALFNRVISEETKNGTIVKANAYLEMVEQYLENYGFIVNKVDETDLSVSLELSNNKYVFKDKNKEEIVADYEDKNFYDGEILKIEEENLKDVFVNMINNKKYLMTRYFKDKNGSIYICFEKQTEVANLHKNISDDNDQDLRMSA